MYVQTGWACGWRERYTPAGRAAAKSSLDTASASPPGKAARTHQFGVTVTTLGNADTHAPRTVSSCTPQRGRLLLHTLYKPRGGAHHAANAFNFGAVRRDFSEGPSCLLQLFDCAQVLVPLHDGLCQHLRGAPAQTQTHRHTDTQTDTHTHTHRHTHRHTDTHRHRYTHTQAQIHTHTHTHTHTERHRHTKASK